MRRKSAGLAVLVFGLCGLLTGCADTPALVEVKGKVTYKGKGIGNVKVDFQPDPDKGTRGKGSAGVTDTEGNFTLQYEGGKAGAIVGHHRVVLTDLDLYGNVFVGRGDYRSEDPKGGKSEVPKAPRFPAKYSDLIQTPVKQEVTVGMGPVTIEIK